MSHSHFTDILNHFQGKQVDIVPDAVITRLRADLPTASPTLDDVLASMKRNRLHMWYGDTVLIHAKLTGAQPRQLPADLEERIKYMHLQIPTDKLRRLGPHYVFRKLLELVELEEFIVRRTPLSPAKDLKMDAMWQSLCDELGWSFIPSVEAVTNEASSR